MILEGNGTSEAVHFLFLHAFFFIPGPPKHFMSQHSGQAPQFGLVHPEHSPQRPRERLLLNLTVYHMLITIMYNCNIHAVLTCFVAICCVLIFVIFACWYTL